MAEEKIRCPQCKELFTPEGEEKYCPICRKRVALGVLDGNGGTVKVATVPC